MVDTMYSVSGSLRKLYSRIVLASLIALTLFSASVTGETVPANAYTDSGTIAYVRSNDATGDEIRLIESNGTNDRLLWNTKIPLNGVQQISALTWHPDSNELAFTSRHEEACSFYNSDVYAIHTDGSGYRRITAPPACNKSNGLPTGTVNVYLYNWTNSSGPFYVYFEGAPGPKTITLTPGATAMVIFTNVADFGSFKQWGVVVFGEYRFTSVTGNADVLPGQTVDTGGYITMSYGSTTWGWTSPTWSSDGSEISYVFDGLTPHSIPASSTAPGMIGGTLFNVPIDAFPYSPEYLSWAPAGPRANQLLYGAWAQDYSSQYIYLGTSGSTSPGDALVNVDQEDLGHILLGLAWLPDSSGFLYSKTEGWSDYANIYQYTFATGTSTRLTDFTSGYPRRLAISPDGANVVYEYQATGDWSDLYLDLDLWMMDRNGNGHTLFIQDARAPAWSLQMVPPPVIMDKKVFLPFVRR